jgi:hypothetical protein
MLLLLLLWATAVVLLRAYKKPIPLGPRKYFLLVPMKHEDIHTGAKRMC